jgi:translation initiation factor 1
MSKKQKKIRDFSDLASFAYSTNPDYEPDYDNDDVEGLLPSEQHLEAHFSKKGRGGKIVTIIKGFEGTEQELKALGKEIKNKMGVGGSIKDGEIIIQGNIREKIVAYLKEKGYNVKKIGG